MLIREQSLFICLTLTKLALLYLDMLKFDQVDLVCKGMLCASHRYDAERQTQIALKTLARSHQERKIGFEYGMRVQIEGLASKTELNGKFKDRYIVQVSFSKCLVKLDKFIVT